MKKIICKLFGHKWQPVPFTMTKDYCERCLVERSNSCGCILGKEEG
ncbi:DUF1660 family phage protein [uncultured Lactococcus sp.]|nr:DUF1660 family phage protein [uncultured Lactococcus sp.]